MEKFRIGNDLTVFWAILDDDSQPYDLTGRTVKIFLTHPRGRMEITEDVNIQGNVISWLFRGRQQRYLGVYKLTVEIFSSPTTRVLRRDIDQAFSLVSATLYVEESNGRPQINETGKLTLSTILEVYQIMPIVPQVGPNRNWWVDGVDTGKPSTGMSAYEFAKENGYTGTEAEYAAECLAVATLNEESRIATAASISATQKSVSQHEYMASYMEDEVIPNTIRANEAAGAAELAKKEADVATANANEAAGKANEAAKTITDAVKEANTATQNANTATAEANDATAQSKSQYAQVSSYMHGTVNPAVTRANKASAAAEQATENATSAAEEATAAADYANVAADNANTAANRAENEADRVARNLSQISSYMSGAVEPAVQSAKNAAAEATAAAEQAEKDVEDAIEAFGPAIDNKADKIQFEGKSYVETDGIATNDFYYNMPDSADGTEDDIIVTKSYLKKINGQELFGKGDIAIEGGGGSYDDSEIKEILSTIVDEEGYLYSNGEKVDMRFTRSLLPVGTSIPAKANLNSKTYLKIGKYYCRLNVDAQTITNCPTSEAFSMEVFNPLGTNVDDEDTSDYTYRLRVLTAYKTGVQYIQYCATSGTPGSWTYNGWFVVPRTSFSLASSKNGGTAAKGASNRGVYIDSTGTFQQMGYTIAKSVPSNAIFTDTNTKVTSVGNHYAPAEDEAQQIDAPDGEVVTGLKRDAAGHVVGVVSAPYSGGGDSYDDTELRQEIALRNVGAIEVEGETEAPDVQGGGALSATNVTYSELVDLRNNGALVAGFYYRITDYITTTAQENTQSAEHPFDVIVLALSENTLAEEAYAIQSARDTDGYFANSNLAAWKLWYSLDNDTERFAWADAENGKGVIYRMIDEWNNDVPYDFKNIQFKRYILEAADAFATDVAKGGELEIVKEKLQEMSHKIHTDFWYYGEYISDVYPDARYVPFGDKEYNSEGPEVLCGIDENNFGWFYTFYNEGEDASLLKPNAVEGVGVYDNIIKDNYFIFYVEEGTGSYYPTKINAQSLNNIVFVGNNCHSNSFGSNCNSNSFGNDCNSNSFGNDCNSNSFGNGCNSNSFGNDCNSNSFGNGCNSNSFGNDCNSNSFGNGCYSNSFGNYCYSNSFGNYCYSNSFGNYCNSNSFGNGCNSNSFGNYCYSNSFGNDCYSNSFGNDCYSNSFGNSSQGNELRAYYRYITFGEGVQYVTLLNETEGDYENQVQNYRVANGTHHQVANVTRNTSYETLIGMDSKGNLKMLCVSDTQDIVDNAITNAITNVLNAAF